MPNHLKQSSREGIEIDPYIKVEEEKDKQGRVIFRFIRCNLNQKLVTKILRAQATGKSLYISQTRKAQLRYCALSDGEDLQKTGRFQSGVTFCTYFERVNTAPTPSETMVMRSVISPDGDIIHQVRRDCLEEPEIGLAIAQAHHWILEQLLNQLHIKITFPKSWINRLAWGLSLLIVLVATVILLIALVINTIPINPLIFVVMVVICVLLQQVFKRVLPSLKPEFRRLVGHQLLSRLLSPNPKGKKIARLILERF